VDTLDKDTLAAVGRTPQRRGNAWSPHHTTSPLGVIRLQRTLFRRCWLSSVELAGSRLPAVQTVSARLLAEWTYSKLALFISLIALAGSTRSVDQFPGTAGARAFSWRRASLRSPKGCSNTWLAPASRCSRTPLAMVGSSPQATIMCLFGFAYLFGFAPRSTRSGVMDPVRWHTMTGWFFLTRRIG
jgi:hypothetical protein